MELSMGEILYNILMRCQEKNCARLCINQQEYCPKHLGAPVPKTQLERYPHHILYRSKRWAMLRNKKIVMDPLCEECEAPAEEIDHILPHKGDVILFYELDNLQSLCKPCHARKSITETAVHKYPIGDFSLIIEKGDVDNVEFLRAKMSISQKEALNIYISDLIADSIRNQTKKIEVVEKSFKTTIIVMYALQKRMRMQFKKITTKDDT